MFVPSAFSPNGDNVNDILAITGNFVREVKHFSIYTRWEVVHFKDNFIPTNLRMILTDGMERLMVNF